MSEKLAHAFFESLAAATLPGPDLLTPDATLTMRFSGDGGPEPMNVFDGRDQVLGYLRNVIELFGPVRFADPVFTPAADDRIVFFEARGDLTLRTTGAPYRNVYVFKFESRDGQIHRITEYANPIAFAALGISGPPER